MKKDTRQQFYSDSCAVSCAAWMVPDTAASLAAVIYISMIIGIILPIIMICK